MELEGEMPVEGRWVDLVVGLKNVQSEIAMMRTPDGHGRVELTKFHTPAAGRAEPSNAPVNTRGIRRIMFAVDDIEDVIGRLRAHGAELVGEVARYEHTYRVGYIRSREGIIIGLAERLGEGVCTWPKMSLDVTGGRLSRAFSGVPVVTAVASGTLRRNATCTPLCKVGRRK